MQMMVKTQVTVQKIKKALHDFDQAQLVFN